MSGLEWLIGGGIVGGFLLNFGVFVWGLGKVMARIDQHDDVLRKLTRAIEDMHTLNTRLAVLEDRSSRESSLSNPVGQGK